MKITILGSGSAYGSPQCFNDWGSIKNINNPKNKRTRCSTYIEVAGKSFLIDMGPDFLEQINSNNIKDIDAIFLTHGHSDHIVSVTELWRVANILDKKINVFCSEQTFAEVKNCFSYLFKQNPEKGSDRIIWNVLKENEEFEFEGVKWKTFDVKHGRIKTTAYRTGNTAFVMDLDSLTDDNKLNLMGLDLLVMECNNGYNVLENGHSNLKDIFEWVKELSPKQTILTHLSTRVDYEEVSVTLPNNVLLAYDGMIIE